MPPDFKLYYEAYNVQNTVGTGIKKETQINGTEQKSHTYTYNEFMIKKQRTYLRKTVGFLISGIGKTGLVTSKRMKLRHYLTAYTKINSK